MNDCICIHPLSLHDENGCADPFCDCLASLPEYGPGVYPDIPHEEYHSLPYIGSTTLKSFRECPAKALIPRQVTEDMNLGSAIHAYVLEGPAAFESRFAIRPEVIDQKTGEPMNKNRNDYRDAIDAFVRANLGKTILPTYPRGVDVTTMEVLMGVEASLKSHPMAGLLLNHSGGLQEVSMIWDDAEAGIRCKGRVDRDPGKNTFVELKKCANIDSFTRQIVDMSYDVGAGHYLNGAEALGIEVDTFVWIAVDHAPPYQVRTVFISGDESAVSYEWFQWSKHEAKRQLRLLAECKASGHFPAYKLTGVNTMAEMSPHQVFEEIEKPKWRQ